MKEILGGELDLAFKELRINAIKTYEGDTHLDDKTQIWELNEEDFIKLCEIKEEDWETNGVGGEVLRDLICVIHYHASILITITLKHGMVEQD